MANEIVKYFFIIFFGFVYTHTLFRIHPIGLLQKGVEEEEWWLSSHNLKVGLKYSYPCAKMRVTKFWFAIFVLTVPLIGFYVFMNFLDSSSNQIETLAKIETLLHIVRNLITLIGAFIGALILGFSPTWITQTAHDCIRIQKEKEIKYFRRIPFWQVKCKHKFYWTIYFIILTILNVWGLIVSLMLMLIVLLADWIIYLPVLRSWLIRDL